MATVRNKLLLLALSAPALTACGDGTGFDFAERLTIVMQGALEQPADATGNREPQYLIMTLVDITTAKDDGSVVDLYDADPKELRILDRAQQLHVIDMADYKGETLQPVVVTFAAELTGAGKTEKAMPATLTTTTVSTGEAFVIKSAERKRLEVHAQWKNIVTLDEDAKTETMTAPGLSAILKDD